MSDRYASLKQTLGHGVVLPDDENYNDLIKRWSTTAEKRPAVIVLPTTAQEVSAVLKEAINLSLPFTVCGGGHSTLPGASSGDDMMVIDLRRMRSVSVSTSDQTVTYGGGSLWADVDAALGEHGLATVGGTVNHTGVGGLVLGGGYGFLSPRYGMAIDNLIEVEVVLADGSIVTASEREREDLFWAIRGAGTSFGVVTRFTSRAYPQGRVWSGMLMYPLDRMAAVVKAANSVLANQVGDRTLLLVLSNIPSPTGPAPMLMLGCFFNGQQAAAEEAFAPLLGLDPAINTTAERPYPEANAAINDVFPHGGRYQFGSANCGFPIDLGDLEQTANEWFGGLERLSSELDEEGVGRSAILMEYFPHDKINSVPFNTTAFAGRSEFYQVVVVMSSKNPGNDEAIRAFKRQIADGLRSRGFAGDQVGDKGVGFYFNYADETKSSGAAFGGNAKRLIGLKKRYDPDNRFNKAWKI